MTEDEPFLSLRPARETLRSVVTTLTTDSSIPSGPSLPTKPPVHWQASEPIMPRASSSSPHPTITAVTTTSSEPRPSSTSTTLSTSTTTPANLTHLPEELLLQIFSTLDIPDLHALTLSSRRFRAISTDRILHAARLARASVTLSWSLSHRPPLHSLTPPQHTIYLTATHQRARALSRKLVAGRLARRLARRESVDALVGRGVLPGECCGRVIAGTMHIGHEATAASTSTSRSGEAGNSAGRRGELATGQKGKARHGVEVTLVWGAGVAPGLVETKRRVERERLKDGLRVWLEKRAQEQRRRAVDGFYSTATRATADPYASATESGRKQQLGLGLGLGLGLALSPAEREALGVKGLVRRFANSRRGDRRAKETLWERRSEEMRRGAEAPPRAKVCGLRRFWEGVAKHSQQTQA